MSNIKASKTVNTLPGVLQSSTIYFVRSGTGFDIFVTNESGTIVAYPLNQSGGSPGIIDGGNAFSVPVSNIDGGGAAV